MNKNVIAVTTGIILLLLIPVSIVAVDYASNPQEVDNSTVTRIENDAYETLWENQDNILDNTWSSDKPHEDYEAATETTTVYPIAPWQNSLLTTIIPLILFAGAIISFSSPIRAFKQSFDFSLPSMSSMTNRGISNGSLIGTIVSVIISVAILAKLANPLNKWVGELTGMYGLEFLGYLIIPVCMIVVFAGAYKKLS